MVEPAGTAVLADKVVAGAGAVVEGDEPWAGNLAQVTARVVVARGCPAR